MRFRHPRQTDLPLNRCVLWVCPQKMQGWMLRFWRRACSKESSTQWLWEPIVWGEEDMLLPPVVVLCADYIPCPLSKSQKQCMAVRE